MTSVESGVRACEWCWNVSILGVNAAGQSYRLKRATGHYVPRQLWPLGPRPQPLPLLHSLQRWEQKVVLLALLALILLRFHWAQYCQMFSTTFTLVTPLTPPSSSSLFHKSYFSSIYFYRNATCDYVIHRYRLIHWSKMSLNDWLQ